MCALFIAYKGALNTDTSEHEVPMNRLNAINKWPHWIDIVFNSFSVILGSQYKRPVKPFHINFYVTLVTCPLNTYHDHCD